jgi:methyltransferase
MIALHVSWLAAIVTWVVVTEPSPNIPLLGLYAALQGLRFWVMATLGPYWTTRIITLRDAPLIKGGPYRFLRHPNYVVVTLEIALLPLVFGAWQIALVFTILNALMLRTRIVAENAALSGRDVSSAG